ncbi:MAG TPA: hypothetical protein VN226_07125 [Anaerolineales bacterium]|nr:hypothetical protein [Anaerolineales bacterium]
MQPLKRISPRSAASAIFMVLLVVSAALSIYYQFLLISYPHQLEYGEGPLLNHAIRLAGGEMIYQPNLDLPPYTVTNYPPVYILTLAIGRILLPSALPFLFGRLISTFSSWAAALAIGAIIHQATDNRKAGLAGALIFGSIPFVIYWSPLLRIDMLALALSLWALFLAISKPEKNSSLVLSALLLLAAIYTRQSYALAAPLTVFVHLLITQRHKALPYTFGLGLTGLFIFMIANLISEGGFYTHIVVSNQNSFSIQRSFAMLAIFAKDAMLPLLATIPMIILRKGEHRLRLVLAVYVLGSLASALTAGKIGSSYNYVLELSAATAIGFGLFLNYLVKIPSRSKWFLAIYPAMAALMLISMTSTQAARLFNIINSREPQLQKEAEIIRLAQQVDGIILADRNHNPLITIGQPIYFQFFERVQMANDGTWRIQPFVDEISNQKFSLVILTKDQFTDERWTPEMFDALHEGYSLEQVIGNTEFYYPKPGK